MKPTFKHVSERIRFLKEPALDSLLFKLQVEGFWQRPLLEQQEWLKDAFDLDASTMDECDIHKLLDEWMAWEDELEGWDDELEVQS